MTGLLGGSVTVKCFYPRTNVNRHDRKYWCKESTRQCVTVISSNGYTAQGFADRATITDFPEHGIFIMEISKLVEKDIGFYKCGIGLNDKGLSFKVKLDVSQGNYSLRASYIIIIYIYFFLVIIVFGKSIQREYPRDQGDWHLSTQPRSLCISSAPIAVV